MRIESFRSNCKDAKETVEAYNGMKCKDDTTRCKVGSLTSNILEIFNLDFQNVATVFVMIDSRAAKK